jgi:hypothetical protein
MYALLLIVVLAGVLGASGAAAWWATKPIRRMRTARKLPMLGVRSPPPRRDDTADLLAYPRRLEELEEQLIERHRAVQQQVQVIGARRDEVSAKGGRDDLARKYDADVAMLERRAEGMRRVMGLVWKTRALLLLRVHLAVTARRRPALAKLPAPGDRAVHLADATSAYHEAATAVRFYLDLVDERAREVDGVVPEPPPSADIDAVAHEAVDRERAGLRDAYRELRDRMDHLADNLTFLGDHFASLAVVDSSPDELRAGSGPAHLLEEVGAAIAGLAELAGKVDPSVVDSAVTHLAREITHLEEAGLEAEAEAEAHLEVERLLGQFHTP